MKANKDALKKNGFWIGLGSFVALWVIAILAVKVGGGESAKKKEWEQAKTTIEGAQKAGVKTKAFQEPWLKHGAKFRGHKDTVWAEAWELQKSMYVWPDRMPVRIDYPDDLWGDPSNEQSNRNEYRDRLYPTQFEGLEQLVAPVEFSPSFDVVFPKQEWKQTAKEAPTREEIWLAQEDVWVRREMLFMVREARDAVARFKEDTNPKEKLPAGVVDRKKLHNSAWELDLILEESDRKTRRAISAKSRIKNLSSRTQSLANPQTNKGILFRINQVDKTGAPTGETFLLEVAGEPLAPGAETELKKTYRVDAIDFSKPIVMDQVFTWETCPIRQINNLEVGRQSHRTVTAGLKPYPLLKELDPEPKAADDTLGGAPGMGGPGMGGPGMSAPGSLGPGVPGPGATRPGSGMSGGPGMLGAGGGLNGNGLMPTDVTKVNSIDRSRYLYVTPQARHLPIALRVVVEQAHIHDMLTAVVNSKLKVQITQLQFKHAEGVQSLAMTGGERDADGRPIPGTGMGPGSGPGMPPGSGGPGMRPPTGPGRPGEGFRPRPSLPGPMAPGSGAVRPPGSGGPGRPGSGPGRPGVGSPGFPGSPGPGYPGTTPEMGGSQDSATSLVELTVYGVASLYERYPPRPTTTTDTPAATP